MQIKIHSQVSNEQLIKYNQDDRINIGASSNENNMFSE